MLCRKRLGSLRAKRVGNAWVVLIAASVALASMSPARADLVFGDFEGSGVPAGWGDWVSAGGVFFDPFTAIPHAGLDGISAYELSSSHATSGSQSLKVNSKMGFDYGLTYSATGGGAATISDFLANDTLSFDVTFPGGDPGGYNNIFGIAVNTNGPGGTFAFYDISPNTGTASFPTPDLTTDQTVQVSYDLTTVPFVAAPTYLQIIIATNNNPTGDVHTTYYFDNFQLSSVPEPSSFAMLSLAGLLGGMVKRRRHA